LRIYLILIVIWFNIQGSLAEAAKKVKLAMYTSDLSDVELKKTKTNNHLSEKKRKVNSSSKNNSSEQLSKQTFWYT